MDPNHESLYFACPKCRASSGEVCRPIVKCGHVKTIPNEKEGGEPITEELVRGECKLCSSKMLFRPEPKEDVALCVERPQTKEESEGELGKHLDEKHKKVDEEEKTPVE